VEILRKGEIWNRRGMKAKLDLVEDKCDWKNGQNDGRIDGKFGRKRPRGKWRPPAVTGAG